MDNLAFVSQFGTWLFGQPTIIIILILVNVIQYRERMKLLNNVMETSKYLSTVDRAMNDLLYILREKSK